MTNHYQARLFAPDGQSVTDCAAPTVAEAWDRVNDLGSRWIFYPLPVIVRAGSNARTGRIVDVCDGLARTWIGKTCGSFADALAKLSATLPDRVETTRATDVHDIIAAL